MSMVLTSTPLWRCTPERNRSIPTISMGCFDVGPVNVSAVDTGLPEGPTLRGTRWRGWAPLSRGLPHFSRPGPGSCSGARRSCSASAPARVLP
ncbi:hypothetical protein CYJ23_09330 [Actinomyces oris]|nr:hypothetical protein CYJ23_09330 [Actinomyces oris]